MGNRMRYEKRKCLIYVLMIVLCVFGISGCGKTTEDDFIEINEKHFPEELLRRKAQEADCNGDGSLSPEEIKQVKKLYLKKLADTKDDVDGPPWPEYSEEDFSFDFEGIQYFTELSDLTVNLLGGELFVATDSGQEDILVTTKNFERIYECTKLKTLSLYEVDVMSLDRSAFPQLTRLELNSMYNLKFLDAGVYEELSVLWVSECHKLELLDVSSLEKLKTLDVVRNSNLKRIEFGRANQMLENIQLNGLQNVTEVDVSYLEHLKILNLIEVGLIGLDVSGNPELEQLCGDGLHLDTLDLRNNPNINYLVNAKDSFKTVLLREENCIEMIRWTDSVVTEFPVTNLNPETLTGIDIQGTAITELDVSGYPNLEYLYYDKEVTNIKR